MDVTRLGPEHLDVWHRARLAALRDAPDAFGGTYAEAAERPREAFLVHLTGTGPLYAVLEGDEAIATGGGFVPDASDDGGEGGGEENWGRYLVVWGMWTAPHARRRGLSRAILDAVCAWADEHDLGVVLDVTETNVAARRGYEAAGFEPTGETRRLRPGSPLHVHRMRLAPT